MARFNGGDVYATWKGLEVNGDYIDITINERMGLNDVTAGNDTDESYITNIRGADLTVNWMVDTDAAGGSVVEEFYVGSEGTFAFGPNGTVAGEYKYEGVFIVETMDEPHNFKTEVSYTAKLKKTGAWINHPALAGGGTWG